MNNTPGIQIIGEKIPADLLKQLCKNWFGDMVKIVADIKRGLLAVGGELHADAEVLLLEDGSEQAALWGANFYPRNEPDSRIEYTALINIRPHAENPSMEILNSEIREKVKYLVEKFLLGPDEKLVWES